MIKRDLIQFVLNALRALGGRGTIAQISKYIWDNHVSIIPVNQRNDLFYTWGYEMRWAGQKLRDQNMAHLLTPRGGVWVLGPRP